MNTLRDYRLTDGLLTSIAQYKYFAGLPLTGWWAIVRASEVWRCAESSTRSSKGHTGSGFHLAAAAAAVNLPE